MLLAVVCILGIGVLWVWSADKERVRRNELYRSILATCQIKGSERDVRFLCDKLLKDQDYIYALMQSQGAVSFGGGGSLKLAAVPEIMVDGNVAVIEKEGHKWEVVRLKYGSEYAVRFAEHGPRGGVRNSLQISEYELLRALAGLEVIREA